MNFFILILISSIFVTIAALCIFLGSLLTKKNLFKGCGLTPCCKKKDCCKNQIKDYNPSQSQEDFYDDRLNPDKESPFKENI